MEKQWKNCGFDVWPLWGRSTEIKPWKKRANRLYGATVRIVGGAFEDLRSLLLHLSASPDAARQKLVHSWHHLSSIYSLSRSSLFLSFLFAPTFALPWLSFLPSQVLHNAQPHEKKLRSWVYHYSTTTQIWSWSSGEVEQMSLLRAESPSMTMRDSVPWRGHRPALMACSLCSLGLVVLLLVISGEKARDVAHLKEAWRNLIPHGKYVPHASWSFYGRVNPMHYWWLHTHIYIYIYYISLYIMHDIILYYIIV